MSWSATFCLTHKNYIGCQQPTVYQQFNLSIHGLWPNYNTTRSGINYPECCTDSTPYDPYLKYAVIQSLLNPLQLYWANEKIPREAMIIVYIIMNGMYHGTCSGLDQTPYMKTVLTVDQMLPTPSIISKAVG